MKINSSFFVLSKLFCIFAKNKYGKQLTQMYFKQLLILKHQKLYSLNEVNNNLIQGKIFCLDYDSIRSI